MTGRPSRFTQAIADEICERLSRGESLRTICEDDHMPGRATVHRWLGESKAFQDQYARAREIQADYYADRIVDDAMVATDAQIGRLRMDALKWAASKLAPKKYGDKVQHVGGNEGDAPIRHSVAIEFV
jgi:hypothetical protein